MTTYLLRRLLYAVPILIGVNLLTFVLFFMVNSPDDMARLHLGDKHVTAEAIDSWKRAHGYDRPLFYAPREQGLSRLTETLFFQKSARLLAFDFGRADDGRDIGRDIRQRMGPSLAIAVPSLLLGLLVNITLALGMVFVRGSRLEHAGVFIAVLAMSISTLFYIIGAQYLLAKLLRLAPVSGWLDGLASLRFLVLPLLVGVLSGLGSGLRWYRLLFLEEAGKDYVRTARAKGLPEGRVLGRPDRGGGGTAAAVHGQPADRIVLRHSGARQLHHRRHPGPGFLHRARHGVPGRRTVSARIAAD
jgi:peptide/nickel transport system permease protein